MIKTMTEAYECFDYMLDADGLVVIAGIEFSPSIILKEMDPIAYDTGFNDYMDGIGVNVDELDEDSEYNEPMDGDFDSGMASAGYGTDEDYGYYGDNDD